MATGVMRHVSQDDLCELLRGVDVGRDLSPGRLRDIAKEHRANAQKHFPICGAKGDRIWYLKLSKVLSSYLAHGAPLDPENVTVTLSGDGIRVSNALAAVQLSARLSGLSQWAVERGFNGATSS